MRNVVLDGGSLSGDGHELESIVIQNDANRNSRPDQRDMQWLQSIVNISSNEVKHARRSKIHKVPLMLRRVEENRHSYDPLVVSIGPYHHGKPELQLMEEHKLTMAHQYVGGEVQVLENLYKKVMDVAREARKCYTDEDALKNFDEKEFTQMIFLDGCFILQFIYCLACNKRSELKMKDNVIAFVQRDLLLLENQIPFQVLKELISSKFKEENEWKKLISDFVAQIRAVPPRAADSYKKKISKLFGKKQARSNQQIKYEAEAEPAHLLDLFRSHLFDKSEFTKPPPGCSDWYSYRSAKELKAVGIHFRPSKSNKLTDVSFKSMFLTGILKLPPIYIDDFTKSILLNMVAYEGCPDGPDDFGVSSYICLMDSLIDHAEDVQELRSKGILLNFLGSDQQVAELFNQVSDNLVANPDAYALVRHCIERHYKNKLKIWVAEWLHTHFTSPWTVLAFIGAVFALFLTVLQTYESFTDGSK